jgi:pseudoazurin
MMPVITLSLRAKLSFCYATSEKERSMKLTVVLMALMFAGNGAFAKTIEVKMVNKSKDGIMAFEPGFVKADPGDTIKFIPTDQAHSSSSALVPAGAKAWVGKMNQAVTVTLNKDGVYIFKCDPHVPMAMVGVVQVGKATNLDAAKAEAKKMAATFAMNKDRLEKYIAQVK